MRLAEDVRWAPNYAAALEEAKRRRVPLMLKALGQGTTPDYDWCPAGSVTRAFAFSDPNIAALLNEKFVNVKFSMWIRGPDTDAAPRDLVLKHGYMPFPGLLVLDPDENVLGKTIYWATPEDSMECLLKALRDRPDLAGGDPTFTPVFDESVPAEREIVALHARFKKGDAEVRRALIPEFTAWLERHADTHADCAAIARCLIGDCHYSIGAFKTADAWWHLVMKLHPKHPMWNRAWYNLIDKRVWPELPIPDLQGFPFPSGDYRPARVQSPERRERNLTALTHDARYLRSPSGEAFSLVPAGTYRMGNVNPKFKNESPRRTVTLTKPFLMSATKVTRAQWAEFRPEDLKPDDLQGLYGQLPMFMVSWYDAVAYCEWKSRKDGWRYRLPTEAEWERAARGGVEDKQFAWGDEPLDDTRANWTDPAPVACFEPNGYGLFDMTGNGGEWCSDYYRPNAFSLTPGEVVDPPGPTAEEEMGRMQRTYRGNLIGHHFDSEITYLGWRVGTDSQRKLGCIGMRLSAEIPE